MYSLPLGGDCDRRVGLWAAAAGKNKRNEHAGADALTARAHAPPPGVILFYFILFYPFSPTAPIPRCCRTKGLGGPSAVAAGGLPLLGIDICATSTLRRVLCASPLAQVQRAGILLLPLLLLQRLRRRFRLLLVASHFSLPLAFRGLVFLLVAARTHTWGNVAGRDWWLDGMRGGGGVLVGALLLSVRSRFDVHRRLAPANCGPTTTMMCNQGGGGLLLDRATTAEVAWRGLAAGGQGGWLVLPGVPVRGRGVLVTKDDNYMHIGRKGRHYCDWSHLLLSLFFSFFFFSSFRFLCTLALSLFFSICSTLSLSSGLPVPDAGLVVVVVVVAQGSWFG